MESSIEKWSVAEEVGIAQGRLLRGTEVVGLLRSLRLHTAPSVRLFSAMAAADLTAMQLRQRLWNAYPQSHQLNEAAAAASTPRGAPAGASRRQRPPRLNRPGGKGPELHLLV